MSIKHSYKIEQDGENFVLVETSSAYGNPEIRVPYSIQQEAENGINAACLNADGLLTDRKMQALYLVREISRLFLQADCPDASALLATRCGIERLVTASISEIRNQAECALPVAGNTAIARVNTPNPGRPPRSHHAHTSAKTQDQSSNNSSPVAIN
ncbi:hypothetical protein [Acetobacter senegalensis]|uniref:hypothetical protein n=1 Tax=Acetobacter senegalensis TaxID=446692 RepID=UPI001EDBE672|nr:hypothetical protein [Acetobacter senegalensis]MCG4258039.1 hypothetical protein [Acetobacter senegalensis]MCG4267966.1 hypothetical protein [Acetobacter senegalensis]